MLHFQSTKSTFKKGSDLGRHPMLTSGLYIGTNAHTHMNTYVYINIYVYIHTYPKKGRKQGKKVDNKVICPKPHNELVTILRQELT